MDVLGFEAKQLASIKAGSAEAEFQRFYGTVSRELQGLNATADDPANAPWRLKVFTDNIVIGYPLRDNHAESVICEVTQRISQYQLRMARDGYFVRGGLASGTLFMDEYLAYGPALLEAYRLEHEVARDPRIVISKEVRSLVEAHFCYYTLPQNAPQNRAFLLDPDGQLFLNYLYGCFEPLQSGGPADTETLLIHKEHIEKGLMDYSGDSRVWAKYAWLASYHNFIIHENLGSVGLSSQYLVSNTLHRTSPVRIVPFLIPSRNLE